MIRTKPSEIALTAADIEQALSRASKRRAVDTNKVDKVPPRRPAQTSGPKSRQGPQRSRNDAITTANLSELRWQYATPSSAEFSDDSSALTARLAQVDLSTCSPIHHASSPTLLSSSAGTKRGIPAIKKICDLTEAVESGFSGRGVGASQETGIGPKEYNGTCDNHTPDSDYDDQNGLAAAQSTSCAKWKRSSLSNASVSLHDFPELPFIRSSLPRPGALTCEDEKLSTNIVTTASYSDETYPVQILGPIPVPESAMEAAIYNMLSPLDMVEQRASLAMSRAPSLLESTFGSSPFNSLPRRRPPRSGLARAHVGRSASATEFSGTACHVTYSPPSDAAASQFGSSPHPLLGQSSPTLAIANMSLTENPRMASTSREYSPVGAQMNDVNSITGFIHDFHEQDRHLINGQNTRYECPSRKGPAAIRLGANEPRRPHGRQRCGSLQSESHFNSGQAGRAYKSSPPSRSFNSSSPPVDIPNFRWTPPRERTRRYHRRPAPAIRPQGPHTRPETVGTQRSRVLSRWQEEQENSFEADERAMISELRAREQRQRAEGQMDETPPSLGRFMRHAQ
ncbi:hypothetical protein EJ05DRAFT_486813 [Pseudovirgaria hyperparasitica]|uniref:Uncharacterized protein n=1 Tax=Pseudovirgaria hyperparasitica TaxID=470096 RepID=A0A6A6W5I3_9PEZI|nr:uncharacterized protein EJ05DRAFT_486813 [Pseudovirgaria hyperparasitica]KAF2757805.1 hypothetical protein EJ05DRAFT_486813 [Pseudovirgaria hyperparasitica]